MDYPVHGGNIDTDGTGKRRHGQVVLAEVSGQFHARILARNTSRWQSKLVSDAVAVLCADGQGPPNMKLRARQLREQAGYNLAEAAERLGITEGQLSRLERGKSDVNLARLESLAKLYHCQPTDLISNNPPVMPIRVVGFVQAGIFREAIEWPPEEIYVVSVPENPDYAGLPRFGWEVRGDSMDRLYSEGDVVVCVRPIDADMPNSGDHVIVQRISTDGLYEATLKEFRQTDDGEKWLIPHSSNPRWTPFHLNGDDGEFEIIGIVTSFTRHVRKL